MAYDVCEYPHVFHNGNIHFFLSFLAETALGTSIWRQLAIWLRQMLILTRFTLIKLLWRKNVNPEGAAKGFGLYGRRKLNLSPWKRGEVSTVIFIQ